jgi:hypothetical protein
VAEIHHCGGPEPSLFDVFCCFFNDLRVARQLLLKRARHFYENKNSRPFSIGWQ